MDEDTVQILDRYILVSFDSIKKSKIFHFFMIIIEELFIIIHELDIYHNNFSINYSNKISPALFLLEQFKKLSLALRIIIYLLIVFYTFTSYIILNKVKLKLNKFIQVLANINELLIYRLFSIFILILLASFHGFVFLINAILTSFYVGTLIKYITSNHLYFFAPNILDYPFDYFSEIIDMNYLAIKIFLIFASAANSYYITILCIIIIFGIKASCLVYVTYIMKNKSYYLMNNVFLNKIRYASILSITLIQIIYFFISKKNVLNIFYLVAYIDVFIICIILINMFYDPYIYMNFKTDEHIENVYYYFFVLNRNKNKYFLLEEKLDEHVFMCNKCFLCKKYKQLKLFYENPLDTRINNIHTHDLFQIIYNGKNNNIIIMNDILRGLKLYGLKSLYESYYLINILYCYYLSINNKSYIMASNYEILFNIIYSENSLNKQQNHISIKQIKSINNFLNKANEILNNFSNLLLENNPQRKMKQFFELGNFLHKLKISNFTKNDGGSNNAKTEPSSENCNDLITLCSIFYEEVFNTCLSSSGVFIRESTILIEEFINSILKNKNRISIEIDINGFKSKIIRAGGKLNKYVNKKFTHLFPDLFKNLQIIYLKNNILRNRDVQLGEGGSQKVQKKPIEKAITKNNTTANDKKKFFTLNFVIMKEKESSVYYRILNLKAYLLLPDIVNNYILLNGIYTIDKNVFLSRCDKNQETIVAYGNKHFEHQYNNCSSEIATSKETKIKTFNNIRVIPFLKYTINQKKYYFYHFFKSKNSVYKHSSKKYLQKADINISENDDGENNRQYEEKLFNDIASQSSSVLSKESRAKFSLYNRPNKQAQNNITLKKSYNIIKYILYFMTILQFIFTLIELFIFSTLGDQLLNKNDCFKIFKTYDYIFHNLLISSLSLGCIATEPKKKNCKIKMDSLFTPKDMQGFPNFTTFFFSQNSRTYSLLDTSKNELLRNVYKVSLSENFFKKFNGNMDYYIIKQNVTNGINYLSLRKESKPFYETLTLMTRSLGLISINSSYMYNPIHILNKLGNNSFDNIFVNSLLTSYQENYYLTLLNVNNYNRKFEEIGSLFMREITKERVKLKNSIILIINLNMCFALIIFFTLFYYLLNYFIIIIDLITNIGSTLNEKYGEQTQREILLYKIQNLSNLLKYYQNNIDQTLTDLNNTYSDYLEKYSQKLKEEAKLLKNENKHPSKSENNKNNSSFIAKIKLLSINYEYMRSAMNISFFFYFFLISFIITVAIYIYLLISWISFYQMENKTNNAINLNSHLANTVYKTMGYYLLMIYNNMTFEGLSSEPGLLLSETEDFDSFIYKSLSIIYVEDKYLEDADIVIKQIKNVKISNCQEFYNSLNFDSINAIKQIYNGKLINHYISMCESSGIMSGSNLKTIYAKLFNMIKLELAKIQDYSYSGLIYYLNNGSLGQFEVYFLTIYKYLLEYVGKNVIIISINSLFGLLLKKIKTTGIIYIVFGIVFGAFLFIIFVRKVDNDCRKLFELQKIFQICQISE